MVEDNTSAMRFTVHGRVQGVGFRAATQRQAIALGIAGWVQNAADGTVTGLAQGPADALKAFHRWLLKGPPSAAVQQINWHPAGGGEALGFEIR